MPHKIYPVVMFYCFIMIACSSTKAELKPDDTSASVQPVHPSPVDFDSLWDYDHPEQTEKLFSALLPEFPASEKPLMRAELLTQIARTQSLQGIFDKAHTILDEAAGLIGPGDSIARIRLHLERGRTYNSAGDKEKARSHFLMAFSMGERLQADFHTVDAAHMIGIVEEKEEALRWNQKALALAEKSPDEKAQNWQGSLYNNIGWTYFDQGKYKDTLLMFQKALTWRMKRGKEPQIRIAKWSVAKVQRMLGNIEDALALQIQLEEELAKAGEKDGFVYEELAECYAARGEAEKAGHFATLAHRELSGMSWFVKAYPERLERLKILQKR